MDIDFLQKRFQIWKFLLFINIGASVTLLLQAVLHYLESPRSYLEISWYGAWFIVQLATFFPGFVLLWGKHWQQIPLHERLNTIFGYFAAAWFTLLPVGVSVDSYAPKLFNFFLLGCAIAITVSYWSLRRKNNEIFL